jgi:signal transduction histidine kinase
MRAARLATMVVVALGAAALAVWATSMVVTSDFWELGLTPGNRYDGAAAGVAVAAVWLLPLCGMVLWWWRPANRAGLALLALGVAWALWIGAIYAGGLAAAWLRSVTVVFRPLLFWLVLSWPVGRLRRVDVSWVATYSAVQASALLTLLFDPHLNGTQFANPLSLVALPRVVSGLSALQAVVVPVGALVLVAAVARRYTRLPAAGRRLARPVLSAAAFVAAGDLVLFIHDFVERQMQDDNGTTLLGGFVGVGDYARFAVVPVMFVVAARRSRRAGIATDRVRSIVLPPAVSPSLQASVAAALGDRTARVAYRREDGTWLGSDGAVVDLAAPRRTSTIVELDGAPIAAVEYDDRFADRPTTVEAAVTAAGVSIECERLKVLAGARRDEALRARRTILDVHDRARQRLERDLHDGAQQRLVALALQASIDGQGRAVVEPDVVAAELRAGVDMARAELHQVAAGLLPGQLAERGFGASLATLAATVPLAVDVSVECEEHLSSSVAAAAWFVVAEAVANAVKHSGATHLSIHSSVDDGWFAVAVIDDGCGGAVENDGSGLVGLRNRVASSGGILTIASSPGAGTVVLARFPEGARR